MANLIVGTSSPCHCTFKKFNTGEVVWEGEASICPPEIVSSGSAVDEYDALMRKLYLKLHRKLWNWIADETERTHACVDKYDAFKHFGWKKSVWSQCWACQYRRWKTKYYLPSGDEDCEKNCIVNWGTNSNTGKELACVMNGSCEYSAYENWKDYCQANDWLRACFAAREIANLTEKK